MAIRANQSKLYQMKKAIGAVLWHCTDFSDEKNAINFAPEMKILGASGKRISSLVTIDIRNSLAYLDGFMTS